MGDSTGMYTFSVDDPLLTSEGTPPNIRRLEQHCHVAQTHFCTVRGSPFPCCMCGKATTAMLGHPALYPQSPGGPTWIDMQMPCCSSAHCRAGAQEEFISIQNEVASETATAPPVETVHCRNCAKPNVTLQCSRCTVARYCNAECQKADWPNHKSGCKTVIAKTGHGGG
jgi:hypothetical protein